MQGTQGRGYSGLCRTLDNAADESLRLARRVKINEIKSTIILFTNWVFTITSLIFTTCCYYIIAKLLINFHARIR